MKILCEFDEQQAKCPVTENMGFQGGRTTKAVIYQGKERIVQKYGDIYKPRGVAEKLGLIYQEGR